ncbi:MAG: hypothetical protein ACON4Z_06465 [Planctomycetota bacterium]
MTATQALQGIYRRSLRATVLCWLIDRLPTPTRAEGRALLTAALRIAAVVAVATVVAWATCELAVDKTPALLGSARMTPHQYWVMKGVMMLLASWSAVRCLRLSRSGDTLKAFVHAGLSGLVASFVFVTWCYPLILA